MSDDEHRIVGAAREALLLAKDAQIARLTAERDAALAGAVRVKKLVWSGDSPLRSEAFTAFGDYVVTARHDGVWRLLTPTAVEWVSYVKQETAKAAAQADHDARIRAAIEPAAPSVSAAAKVLLDLSDKVQVIRREAAIKRHGVRSMALDEVLHMIREMIDALATKENSDE